MQDILPFAKLQGLGNDFILLDGLAKGIDLSPGQIAHMCDRHFGIGADGVIVVRPSPQPGCAAYMLSLIHISFECGGAVQHPSPTRLSRRTRRAVTAVGGCSSNEPRRPHEHARAFLVRTNDNEKGPRARALPYSVDEAPFYKHCSACMRRASSSASSWRLTLPVAVLGMASMYSMRSGHRRFATCFSAR